MGTKGTSLAPYWADRFCDYLLDGQPLDAEVDIRRFEHYLDAQKVTPKIIFGTIEVF